MLRPPSDSAGGAGKSKFSNGPTTHYQVNLTFPVAGATMSLSFEVLRSAGAGVTQLVECDLAKVDVAGSNPVSRSIPALSGPDT